MHLLPKQRKFLSLILVTLQPCEWSSKWRNCASFNKGKIFVFLCGIEAYVPGYRIRYEMLGIYCETYCDQNNCFVLTVME